MHIRNVFNVERLRILQGGSVGADEIGDDLRASGDSGYKPYTRTNSGLLPDSVKCAVK